MTHCLKHCIQTNPGCNNDIGSMLMNDLYLASSAGMSDVITGHCCTPLCSFVMWDRATCSNTGPLLCQISMKCRIYL